MYHNPVKVIETDNYRAALTNSIAKLNINNPLVVTSIGNIKRNNLFEIFDKKNIFSDIVNNPTFESCQRAIDFCSNNKFDGVIAIGGGARDNGGMKSLGSNLLNQAIMARVSLSVRTAALSNERHKPRPLFLRADNEKVQTRG